MDNTFAMPGYQWPWVLDGRGELRGRPLRYLLTTILNEAGHELTVRELIERCEREGVVFNGRASKIVSDALRWEINWGRVTRVKRGTYRSARVARSTRYWIAQRIRAIRIYLDSVRDRSSARPPARQPFAASERSSGPAPNSRLD